MSCGRCITDIAWAIVWKVLFTAILLAAAVRAADPFDGAIMRTNGPATREYRLAAVPPAAPKLRITLAAGQAPAAVHVTAEFPPDYPPGASTQLEWDFGDGDGSYNRLRGFNAAHIYDNPGEYNIRLRWSDGAADWESKTTLTVETSRRREVRLGPDGDLAAALTSLKDDVALLLARGGRYSIAGTLRIGRRNIVLGAWGEGERPILMSTAKGNLASIAILDTRDTENLVIENLCFDSVYPAEPTGVADKIPALGLWARGRNLTIRNCVFLNLSDAINANSQPQGLLVQDNAAPLATGIRGYFLWFEGSDGVVLGNTVANSTRERPMRMNAYNRVLIAYNDFTDLDRTSVDPSDGSKGSLWAMAGQYVWIDSNKLQGQLQVGPNFGVNPIAGKVGSAEERSNDVVIEDNQLFEPTRLLPGLQRASIRNNVAKVDNAAAFVIEKYNAEYDRLVKNVSFINNTAINGGSRGCFLFLTGQAQGLQVKQNLYQAMNLKVGSGQNGGLVVYQSDLSSFSSIDKNFWSLPSSCQKAQHYVWPTWFDARGQVDAAAWNQLPAVGQDWSGAAQLDAGKTAMRIDGTRVGAKRRD